MDGIGEVLHLALGLGSDGKELDAGQMALRAAVVYIVVLAMVRLGKKRFMGRSTPFDVILGIMLGSVVSRGITGNAPFLPTLVAAAALLALHWLLSALALCWAGFGRVVKGRARVLVRDGEVDRRAMRRAHMTERDLSEELRSQGVANVEDVAEAREERSGKVSVIEKRGEPKVVEVMVADGVQTVRVEIA